MTTLGLVLACCILARVQCFQVCTPERPAVIQDGKLLYNITKGDMLYVKRPDNPVNVMVSETYKMRNWSMLIGQELDDQVRDGSGYVWIKIYHAHVVYSSCDAGYCYPWLRHTLAFPEDTILGEDCTSLYEIKWDYGTKSAFGISVCLCVLFYFYLCCVKEYKKSHGYSTSGQEPVDNMRMS